MSINPETDALGDPDQFLLGDPAHAEAVEQAQRATIAQLRERLAAEDAVLRRLAQFVVDHPDAARGMGDGPHTAWVQMQEHARSLLTDPSPAVARIERQLAALEAWRLADAGIMRARAAWARMLVWGEAGDENGVVVARKMLREAEAGMQRAEEEMRAALADGGREDAR